MSARKNQYKFQNTALYKVENILSPANMYFSQKFLT